MNLSLSCTRHPTNEPLRLVQEVGGVRYANPGRKYTTCMDHAPITRADLAARDAEIAGLREVREAVLSAIRGRLAATGFFAMTKRLGDALDASRNPPVNRTTEGAKL